MPRISPPKCYQQIVAASPIPLHTYLSLLSLSHSIRTALRGTLREISFVLDESVGMVSLAADALAAIVGPCKDLGKLTLPERQPKMHALLPLVGCGLTEAACRPWVDEAFAGHSRLAVLHIPSAEPLWPAIRLILAHLPGLVELHCLHGRPICQRFLEALASSCPGLQTLHISTRHSAEEPEVDFTALAPLGGTLKELRLPSFTWQPGEETLAKLAAGLAALERLELYAGQERNLLGHIPTATAGRLTCLTISTRTYGLGGIDPERFCRLETVNLSVESAALAGRLLTASQATLRSVTLTVDDPPQPVFDALGVLGGLRSLDLCLRGPTDDQTLAALPPGLLGRLEQLTLRGPECTGPVRLASSSLRALHLGVRGSELALACPALEELTLASLNFGGHYESLVMDCPRLRSIMGLAVVRDLSRVVGPMSDLVRADGSDGHDCHWADDPAWLPELLALAPRLQVLSGLCLTRPGDLGLLWSAAAAALTSLRVEVEETAMPTGCPPALRLPARLELLEFIFWGEPAELCLCVEAPGLRSLRMLSRPTAPVGPTKLRMTLNCPALEALDLEVACLAGVRLAKGTAPPLRSLRVDTRAATQLEAASLLDILTRHGDRLRQVFLREMGPLCRAAWPQLAVALGRLPRLASLEIPEDIAPQVALACPPLRQLYLLEPPTSFRPGGAPGRPPASLRSLVLDCPLLEELQAPFSDGTLERFELTRPAANLRRIGWVKDPWRERLRSRLPQAALEVSA
ncbi:hypothetical protein PAPYR_10541 [Paratrimastix pyriformis]|uniref:Uncharacterized protein n=1 Tax=Paratrimastix pyriformis TaxID=342808 RepID=A0ABQ8U9Y3_9EUKA|nr:hypothetical protein PAPYR_10541 [Paratrimastix pyriformis]